MQSEAAAAAAAASAAAAAAGRTPPPRPPPSSSSSSSPSSPPSAAAAAFSIANLLVSPSNSNQHLLFHEDTSVQRVKNLNVNYRIKKIENRTHHGSNTRRRRRNVFPNRALHGPPPPLLNDGPLPHLLRRRCPITLSFKIPRILRLRLQCSPAIPCSCGGFPGHPFPAGPMRPGRRGPYPRYPLFTCCSR